MNFTPLLHGLLEVCCERAKLKEVLLVENSGYSSSSSHWKNISCWSVDSLPSSLQVVAGVGDKHQSASIALFLVGNGADPDLKNKAGQSAIELCPDPSLSKALSKAYKPKIV